jgi:hypothetical protein
MSNIVMVNEGIQEQYYLESLSYGLTTTPWGSTPTSIDMIVIDITDEYNPRTVTDDVTTGSPAALGNVITLAKLGPLTPDHKYRVEVPFTDSDTNEWCAVFEVKAIG